MGRGEDRQDTGDPERGKQRCEEHTAADLTKVVRDSQTNLLKVFSLYTVNNPGSVHLLYLPIPPAALRQK